MNTKKGNFDEIIGIFKNVIADLDGYITHNGKVNWNRFNVLLKEIFKQMELKMIATTANEMNQYLNEIETGQFSKLVRVYEESDDELLYTFVYIYIYVTSFYFIVLKSNFFIYHILCVGFFFN